MSFPVIATCLRPFIWIVARRRVISSLQCSISPRNHRFIVSSLRYVVSSLRMNRADLGTILTTLNMAAMKRSTTSGELKAFIRSNIQQILNGANNNRMEEKGGINYYFVLRYTGFWTSLIEREKAEENRKSF